MLLSLFDRRVIQRVAIGGGLVALVLAAYAQAPDKAGSAEGTGAVQQPAARIAVAQAKTAAPQAAATVARIEERIPLPEPANVPPPTAADFARNAPLSETAIAALVPVPEPAGVPPITVKDIGEVPPAQAPAPTTTASVPAETAPAVDVSTLTGKDLAKAPLAANLDAADAAIAGRLRDLLAARLDRIADRRNERSAIEAFYRDRGFAPLWVENGKASARGEAAIAYLNSVDQHGMVPADYPTPRLAAGSTPESLAEGELRLTLSALTYARHAQMGRVHFTRISGDIEYHMVAPEPADVLARLAKGNDAAAALDGYQPQHAEYQALKQKLAEVRNSAGERKDVVRIPEGPTLKLGVEDGRVPALRKRLEIAGDRNSWRYDEPVAEAVARFQKNAGLTADGMVGPATLRALNGVPSRANPADTIIANMERWRWMPRDLGAVYSMVNIPDFMIKVVRNGAKIWETRTVVGRPTRLTPLISTEMKFITVNPTWNVPPGIMANDYLPALREDPTVLERMGIKVEENRDGTVRMYMPPGDKNALGRLRFNFPNKFLVYQHDTPDKHLFDRTTRAYSSGCMRVQDPVKYAEILLSIALPNERYTQERIRSMFGPSEININFPRPIQVHLTYQTAFVDEKGKLQLRDDVYGHDQRLIAILRGSERPVADVAIPRRLVHASPDDLRWPEGFRGRFSRSPVEDFFGRLFR